eukprot:UN22816
MVQQTLSIATFVGPFQKYGSVLVRACAKYGTHYADSTGESAWMRQMIGMYHQQAIKSGARILHQTAFDSVPADMCTLLCSKEFQKTNEKLKDIRLMTVNTGFWSGGTVSTLLSSMESPKFVYPKKDYDSLYTNNEGERSESSTKGGSSALKYHNEVSQYGGFFFLAPGNCCATRRTGAYEGYDLKYNETLLVGNIFKSLNYLLYNAIFGSLLPTALGQSCLQMVLPKSGEGPSPAQLEKSVYWINAVGTSNQGNKAYVVLGADVDGGYVDTGTYGY